MTEPAGGSQVDWDLLADHLGGALAGTPEDARVARLVEADPVWRRAAANLSAALGAVAADLRALPAAPMPAEVSARLEAALREAVTSDLPAAGSPASSPHEGGHPAPRGATTRDAPPGSSTPARRGDRHPDRGRSTTAPLRPPRRAGRHRGRRRVARWGAGLAVAAGVAVAAMGGLAVWGPGSPFTALDQAETPEAMVGEPDADGETPVVASGINYHPESLTADRSADTPLLGPEAAGPAAATDARQGDGLDDTPAGLDRLWTDPVALSECLALVEAALSPATVDLVDFAMFQDEPALVIWVTTAADERWVWVSGPECGTAAGADERFRTRLR